MDEQEIASRYRNIGDFDAEAFNRGYEDAEAGLSYSNPYDPIKESDEWDSYDAGYNEYENRTIDFDEMREAYDEIGMAVAQPWDTVFDGAFEI